MFLTAHSKPNASLPDPPKPIVRPGQRPHEEGRRIGGSVTYSREELDRIFASAKPKEVTADGH